MNNPQTVMAVYKAKSGRHEELKKVLIEHTQKLKEWGFITSFPPVILKTEDDSIIEIFEWKDGKKAEEAHHDNRVQALWKRFSEVADFRSLADLDEAKKPFSHFKRMGKITKTKERKLADTMIAAKNYEGLLNFYSKVFGFSPRDKFEDFANFVDPETLQVLCITNGPSVMATSPGISVENLEETLQELERSGGKIMKRWEYGPMKGANCADPEGNALMVWSGIH